MTIRNVAFRLSLDDGIKQRLVEVRQQAAAIANLAVKIKVDGVDKLASAAKAAFDAGQKAKSAGDLAHTAMKKAGDAAAGSKKSLDSVEKVFSEGIPNALKTLDKHLVSTVSKLSGVSSHVAAIGVAAAATAATALAAGLGISFTKAADLEAAMVRISKLTGIEDKAALSKDVQKMMKATGKQLPEVSAAYEMAGSAGIGGKLIAKGDLEGARKEIEGFVQVTLQAADAFEMPAEAASSGLSAINTMLKPVGIATVDFMSKVGSAIDAAGNATIAKEKDILAAMQKAAGSVSFAIPTEKLTKDMIALSTAIISTGESGDSAGESIKDFMRNAALDKEGKVSASIGMDKGTFQKNLKADPGAIVDKLIEKYNKLPASSQGAFSAKFGDTGAKVLTLSRSENYKTAYADAKGVVGSAYDKGTQLSESFKKSMSGFWKQMDRFWQILTVVAQCIGGVFLPAMELVLACVLAVIDPLSSLLAGIISLGDVIPGMKFAILVGGLFLAASAVGILLTVLMPLIAGTGLYTTAMGLMGATSVATSGYLSFLTSGTVLQTIASYAMTASTVLATVATWALNAALAVLDALNPFTYIIVGAIALIACLSYLNQQTGFLGKAFDYLTGLKDRFVTSFANIDLVKGLKTIAGDLFKGVVKIGFNLSSTPFGQGVIKTLMLMMSVLFGPLKLLCDLFGVSVPTWETIKNAIASLYTLLMKFVDGVKDALGITKDEKRAEMDKQALTAGLTWQEADQATQKPEGWYDANGNLATPPAGLAKAKADYDTAPKGFAEQFTDSIGTYFDKVLLWMENTFKPLTDVLRALADYLQISFTSSTPAASTPTTPSAATAAPPGQVAYLDPATNTNYRFTPAAGSSNVMPGGTVIYPDWNTKGNPSITADWSDLSSDIQNGILAQAAAQGLPGYGGASTPSNPVQQVQPAAPVQTTAPSAARLKFIADLVAKGTSQKDAEAYADVNGYDVGAEFKRGGRFKGDVHATEEIIPQAITKRGPGPLARILSDIYGSPPTAQSSSGMSAPVINITIKIEKVSSDTDISKLAREVMLKSRDALLNLQGRHGGYLQGGSAYR